MQVSNPANTFFMKTISVHTFGKDKVSVHLSEELNRLGDDKHLRIVGRTIAELKESLDCLKPNLNKSSRMFYYKLLKKYTFNSIDNRVALKDEHVISFLKNAVIIILRNFLNKK